MELFNPENGVADQKILHLILAVVKDLGAPVRVLALSGVRVLVEGFSVEVRQSVGVLGEMRGHPIQNHTDSMAVEVVDKVHEVGRGAVAGGGGKIPRHLIPPGAVERIFGDRHKLYMRVTHLLNIRNKLVRQFTIRIKASVIMYFP